MKRRWLPWAVAAACCGAQAGELGAEDPGWRVTRSFESWFYAARTEVRGDAVLNPGNAVARLSGAQGLFDGRFNLRAEQGPWQFVANPRLLEQRGERTVNGDSRSDATGSARLSQGFARYKDGDSAWTVGRELFTWGPGNFRSPSNPFYFDAGRTNPLASTPGVDLVRSTVGLGSFRVTGAYVFSTSQILPAEDLGRSVLLKLDQQGRAHLLSLIASQQRGGAPFLGGFAQLTPDDAWLLYGEFGSQRLPRLLSPNPVGAPGPFYRLQQPAPRSLDLLLGASYTLESGQALIAEVLHGSGGYGAGTARAYFDQARAASLLAQRLPAQGLAALGQALGQQPRLLGRDYLWLNWQSNPQTPGLYWRLGWSQNLGDHSGQALAYAEKSFVPRLSGFVSLALNRGGAQSEYGALWRSSLTLGVKWFVF
ncbi:hypothetical protein [Xylophilus sp. ASV27]|uniref:hypothetical protein n=1 Tax=Xylophilus sp. ASV27 TaxID=2795129 RepID=UPI0018EC6CB2|nr:hypothetical protein [Xylophilus sp. ASV27]